ncbi:Poly(A) RNA polymerase protein cid1 [Phialemonium atrogriseum]|uniref:polynucleotide adenylyltransferase n=1 Tax=Phialemonium atrogriseum TaxID=1093897 RepID=A0AAJ0C142_9PEZI|nr:Poly(A) RNA polymerase protein cid1 [Phialemonium atrogriseum]KAK1766762.1 Poly(A) RNA polymerase protein cid1 [Phialemonium atrogriseum]
MEAAEEVEGGLDERLRNLILSNASGRGVDSVDNDQSHTGPPGTGSDRPLTVPEVEDKSGPAAPKGARKRPNQAQRRQMSAQLSLPIDSRSPRPLHSARSYASTPGYPGQQYTSGGHHGTQRPHSATFGPSNPPFTGMPFSSQARHYQSLSYNGPIGSLGDWRQPQPQGITGPSHGPLYEPMTPRSGNPASHNPGRQYHVRPEDLEVQTSLLENLCNTIIAGAEIEAAEIAEKEVFRSRIEQVCREVISQYEREQNGRSDFPAESVQLRCFGSLSSGFATKAADLDLGLLSPLSPLQPDAPGSPIPRMMEKALLDLGLGARLLTRTRVPIIKLCEKPPEKLMHDLLEERLKWEKDLPDDPDGDEEPHDEPALSPVEAGALTDSKRQGHISKESDVCQGSSSTYEQKLATLRQSKNQRLPAYFGLAKGMLRKLGGRDLTHSNMADFTPKDYKLLNDVSLALVDGLADEELKKRLTAYRSLSTYSLRSQSQHRSLLGVCTQVEAEKMAMMWFSRLLPEKDEYLEQQAQRWVQFWLDLQNKPTFGADPLGYNKELHLAAEQLKKIASIQILLLQQGQHESATLYHSRASGLMLELGGHDRPNHTDEVRTIVIQQYISGIYSTEIREKIEAFAKSEGADTLRIIARRHKSLQLAHEFERAVEKGLYDESSKADIEAYTAILQGPMQRPPTSDMQLDLVVPATPETAPLIGRIRRLTDPSTLAPNQPRDPYRDPLNIPKTGAGVQCDINFSAHLALQNTLLLRCYAHSDPRVRPLVLFVKHWAKLRGINSPYRGTLSSYGFALMVLHYLVNVAQPFVCPNLQLLARPPGPLLTSQQVEETVTCRGRNVQFWRDEAEIQRLARDNMLTQNRDSIGHLLRGFFEYYAQSNAMSTVHCRGFDWGRDVLSLRTPGGLLTKNAKGWTGAKTVVEVGTIAAPPGSATSPSEPTHKPAADATDSSTQVPSPAMHGQTTREFKEVRHRFLFAIEDPFEHEHNVARTVTHNGIVAIRDEFRRAWRIIKTATKRGGFQEELLQDIAATEQDRERDQFSDLLQDLHGRSVFG